MLVKSEDLVHQEYKSLPLHIALTQFGSIDYTHGHYIHC